jgi:Tfp pilus assembly protein PilN
VRPVNLLPAEHRPRRASGDGKGAYVVLGVLGALLVMVAVYVLSANSVNSNKGDLAEVNRDIARAEAQIGSQSAFGNFQQVKETRLNSVRQLADDRFDWERLVREISLVLPKGTSLNELNASKGPPAEGSSAAPTSSSSTSSTPSDSSGGAPSLHLIGCAKAQRNVADLLVRLRKLHGANDVNLAESAQQVESGEGSTGGSGDSAAGGGADGCAPNIYKFDVTVTFDQLPPATGDVRVPARLGGGS